MTLASAREARSSARYTRTASGWDSFQTSGRTACCPGSPWSPPLETAGTPSGGGLSQPPQRASWGEPAARHTRPSPPARPVAANTSRARHSPAPAGKTRPPSARPPPVGQPAGVTPPASFDLLRGPCRASVSDGKGSPAAAIRGCKGGCGVRTPAKEVDGADTRRISWRKRRHAASTADPARGRACYWNWPSERTSLRPTQRSPGSPLCAELSQFSRFA